MHADRKIPVWTRLKQTAAAGSNQLVLETPVQNWKAGERVVVASTSKDYLQSETCTIQSISADNLTISLVDQLRYNHVGEYERFNQDVCENSVVLVSRLDKLEEHRGK